jgi:SPP1 gp7 family putative phage head morphogenesis protein
MAGTYWEELAEKAEAAAQRVAADRMKYVRQVYREAQSTIKTSVDALYAQILDKGAESVTRTQLWQYSKYQSLLRQFEDSVGTIRSAQNEAAEAAIRKVYTDTIGTSLDALMGKGRWSYPTQTMLDRYLVTPWSGERYSTRIWKNAEKLTSDLRKHMEDLLVLGKSPGAVKKQLMKDFGVSYEIADRLVMTETSNAYNTAAMDSYRKAGVKQVKWVIGPAEGLCERCRTYAYENGGVYDIDDAPHIPVHPRCRCRWVAVVDVEGRTRKIRDQMLQGLQSEGYTNGDVAGIISNAKHASASPTFLNKSDQLYKNAERIKPVRGFEDVIVHGDEAGFVFRDANGVDSNLSVIEFAQILRDTPSYQSGNIRLVACDTGSPNAVTAQALANEMQVKVLAPSKTVFVDWDGNMIIAGSREDAINGTNLGKWVEFKPQRR